MEHLVWSINPVLLDTGIFQIHWYGLFFASAFVIGYILTRFIFKREHIGLHFLDPILAYMMIGGVVGARLAHVIFYDPLFYFNNPSQIPAVWNGGLASHGGAIGITLSLFIFCRKNPSINYLWILDRISIPAVLGGFFIRVGNFFNSEIVGLPSTTPWAVIFPREDNLPRHPTQLYEAFAYLLIFTVMLYTYFRSKNQRNGLFMGMFLTLVFIARFLLEFTKTRQENFNDFMPLNVGQLLSIPVIIAGLIILYFHFRKGKTA